MVQGAPEEYAAYKEEGAPTSPTTSAVDQKGSTVDDEATLHDGKQDGVLLAEASRALMGPWLWLFYLGIAGAAYIYGLDNNTMYAYITASTEIYGGYTSVYFALSVIQQVIIAVGKLPIAKISDVYGRAQGYSVSLVSYVLGFILIASTHSFATTCAGVIFYALGNTGTAIMQQIVIADATTTRWRGLVIGLLSLPYIINFAVASKITAALVPTTALPAETQWRWGPGMFAILAPVVISPIIFTLALSQRRAKKSAAVPLEAGEGSLVGRLGNKLRPNGAKARSFVSDFDLGGLFLLTAGFLLLYLPLELEADAPNGWKTGYIIAMFVLAGVFLISLPFYEWLIAPQPLIKRRFVTNKDVVIPALIGFFDFYAFYLSWSPVYTYIFIIKDWSDQDITYFANIQSIALTIFGIAVGAINYFTRRYKWTLFAGSCIRMLGLGLMVKYRSSAATTAQLVIPQLIQGLGGGFIGITLQLSAEVAVPHQDVAMVIAIVLLLTEIGGAAGTATLGTILANVLPVELAKYLPAADQDLIATITASPATAAVEYAFGTEVRTAIIESYNYYMKICLIAALGISALPVLLSLLVTDRKLNNRQNCVEAEEITDEDRKVGVVTKTAI